MKFQISNFKLLKTLALLSLAALCVSAASSGSRARQAETAKREKGEAQARTLYRIQLDLDFEARSYAGRERVRWVNRDDRATSVLYFHLYPNLRAEDERPGAPPAPPTDRQNVALLHQLPQSLDFNHGGSRVGRVQ